MSGMPQQLRGTPSKDAVRGEGNAANEFAGWQRKHVKTCFNTFPLSGLEFIRGEPSHSRAPAKRGGNPVYCQPSSPIAAMDAR